MQQQGRRAFVFGRPELAERVADVVLGLDPLAGDSGLFLAAPRRTGKSTFLRRDLVPELERRGVATVYVDLWSRRDADPSAVISDAIAAAVRLTDPQFARTARRAGLAKVGIGAWASVEIDRIGVPDGPSIADALERLSRRTDRPVVLVVDEAQHAVTSKAGSEAMFALKSARDVLNMAGDPPPGSNVRLGLVFTGSNRDKLASLVVGRGQPFYGSSVTDFPLLGRDYCVAYAEFVNDRLSPDRAIGVDEMFEAFRLVGHRPEMLLKAVRDHALGTLGDAGPAATLVDRAAEVREAAWEEVEATWSGLTPLQRAVLARLAETGDRFRPFEADAIADYADRAGQAVTSADAQSALEALRDKGVVMRLERGRYVLEDPSVALWLERRSAPDAADDHGPPAPR